jgi:hypothetical protein
MKLPFSKDIVSLNQLEIKERTKEKIVIFIVLQVVEIHLLWV